MNIVGLITEYNPFHNGHLYHLQQSKLKSKADFAIAVMSGNYVQRGEPAFIDKWCRTKMALESGVDMIIEIPTYYSTASAELFAYGAIKLLNSTGIVNSVCFGSETGCIKYLETISNILYIEPPEYKKLLKSYLNQGLGFATARTNSLFDYMSNNNILNFSKEELQIFLSSPNNILGIEYIKSLKKLNSSITPITINRITAGYHDKDTSNNICSATGIRNTLTNKNNIFSIEHVLPKPSFNILKNAVQKGIAPITFNDFSTILNYRLALLSQKKLASIMEISEGLENRILKYSFDNYSIQNLVSKINTKRYTNSRINRALLYIILNITKETFFRYHQKGGPQYLRVLGFRKDSEILFNLMKKRSNLPIVTNIGKATKKLPSDARFMLKDEVKFTDMYTLIFPNKFYTKKALEYTNQIVIV